MALNIGINVVEIEGRAAPAVAGAATSVAAFAIRTRRGAPHKPTLVTSFAQFVQQFGGFETDVYGAHIVKGFFDNGGRMAWVSRVVAGPAANQVAANGILRQTPASNSKGLLDVFAGFRDTPDPGPWADKYTLTAQPSFTAPVKASPALTGTSATLSSVAGFTTNERVVIAKGAKRHVATITEIDANDRKLTWDPAMAAADVTELQGDDTFVASTAIDVIVSDPDGNVVESYSRLSLAADKPNYAVTMLNDPVGGSRWMRLQDKRNANSRVADDAPTEAVVVTLTGGASTPATINDYIGDEAAHTGFHAFDPLDVQLLTADTTERAVVLDALEYCEKRSDCMFVGSVPKGDVAAGRAVEYGNGLQGAKRYGAVYGPWILVTDPLSSSSTPTMWAPPSGHVMGVYARIESSRGIHKAPAGDEARVFGALDVEYRLSDTEHTDMAERGSVNGIRVVPGAGIVVDASRSLSTDIRWRYVNVRLLFNYVKSSLRQGLRWVRQEPNRDTLWTAVTYGSVRPFLMGLWRQGAFGTGEPDDVFTIVCDATNNPPDEVDKGNFTLEVTLYPSKPAEKVLIRVGQQPSGSSVSES